MKELTGLDRRIWQCLTLFALFLPLSIALVQPVAYLGAVLSIVAWWKAGKSLRPPYVFGGIIIAFLVIVALTSIFGIRPETSIKKWNRFLVLALAWAVPWIISRLHEERRWEALSRLVASFMIGLALKAAYDLVRVPVMVSMDVPLFMTGNMRDPQFYMAGLCLVAGMIVGGAWSLSYPPTAAALFLSAAGLIIHFKRGAWAATLCALAVMAVASRKWRPIGAALLVLLALSLVPSVRERIGQLGREFDAQRGGRLLLWTEVGPALIAEHPLGVGWKAVKHEDFVAVTERVEPKLNHLHNNLMHVTLELGWAGMLVWVVWMGSIFVVAWRASRANRGEDPMVSGPGLAVLGAFSAFLFNGMVEYNFGDSEIFMLLMLIMGMAAALALAQGSGPSDRVR